MAGEMLKALSVLRDDLSSSPSIHIEPNNLCNSSSRRFVYLQKLGVFYYYYCGVLAYGMILFFVSWVSFK